MLGVLGTGIGCAKTGDAGTVGTTTGNLSQISAHIKSALKRHVHLFESLRCDDTDRLPWDELKHKILIHPPLSMLIYLRRKLQRYDQITDPIHPWLLKWTLSGKIDHQDRMLCIEPV